MVCTTDSFPMILYRRHELWSVSWVTSPPCLPPLIHLQGLIPNPFWTSFWCLTAVFNTPPNSASAMTSLIIWLPHFEAPWELLCYQLHHHASLLLLSMVFDFFHSQFRSLNSAHWTDRKLNNQKINTFLLVPELNWLLKEWGKNQRWHKEGH